MPTVDWWRCTANRKFESRWHVLRQHLDAAELQFLSAVNLAVRLDRLAEIVPCHHSGPGVPRWLALPQVRDNRRPCRLPCNSQIRQFTIGLADSLGICKEMIVSTIAATSLPAGVRVPLRKIHKMVPAGV